MEIKWIENDSDFKNVFCPLFVVAIGVVVARKKRCKFLDTFSTLLARATSNCRPFLPENFQTLSH